MDARTARRRMDKVKKDIPASLTMQGKTLSFDGDVGEEGAGLESFGDTAGSKDLGLINLVGSFSFGLKSCSSIKQENDLFRVGKLSGCVFKSDSFCKRVFFSVKLNL